MNNGKMALSTDKRNVGTGEMIIDWCGIEQFRSLATESINSCKELIDNTLKTHTDERSKKILDGARLSVSDIENKINRVYNKHKSKSGVIDSNDFENYSLYIDLCSEYGVYTEETATLIGTVFTKFFESVGKNTNSDIIKEQANESGGKLKETIKKTKEDNDNDIIGKLNGNK